LLRTIAADPVVRRQFARYLIIGATVFCVVVSTFALCISHRMLLPLASTTAYFTGTTTHFLLNRYANFRRFDRAIHDQARTFAIIIGVQWLLTLAIISTLVGFGVIPIAARVAAIALNLPLGFLANRYLTFGIGILPRVMGLRKAAK
jgi:putative flippase GtrA